MIPTSHASLALSLLALLAQAPAKTAAPKPSPAPAQAAGAPVRYRVKVDAQEKRWDVAMSVALPKATPFELWIPRWTGGAYHLAEFAQYARDLTATDASGKELKVTKHEPVISWTIDPGAATQVEIHYTGLPTTEGPLGPILALEGSSIASGRANVTPCSLLAFVPELQARPVEIELALPPGWKVATALDRRDDGVFTAPSYLRLEDSPLLMGRRLETTTFEAAGAQHEVAALGRTEEQLKELAETCKKIVESASRMMGGVPYRRYVFLFEFSSRNAMGGGGLEHSYSTLILLGPDGGSETNHVIAHEYFHLWNAERIHVEGLEHPDYTKPFTTGTIWLNEGGTEYVSGLLLVDSGLETQKEFFRTLARNSAQVHSEGMRTLLTQRPWTDVSKAFTNATMMDLLEIAITHYVEGSIVLFALDLEMRRASKGERGVPDLMRYLFENYSKKGRGYGEEELPAILSKVAGADMKPFYDAYIGGKEMVDLAKFVDVIGLRPEGDEKSMEFKLVDVEKPTAEQLAIRKKLFAIAK